MEDVVFIRNTVDRIGSHYSPGTTILTLDIDTGLIKFRKEKTNLKSAWQKKLENSIDLKLTTSSSTDNNPNTVFQVPSYMEDQSSSIIQGGRAGGRAGGRGRGRQQGGSNFKKLKNAYLEMENDFQKAKEKSIRTLRNNQLKANTTTMNAMNAMSGAGVDISSLSTGQLEMTVKVMQQKEVLLQLQLQLWTQMKKVKKKKRKKKEMYSNQKSKKTKNKHSQVFSYFLSITNHTKISTIYVILFSYSNNFFYCLCLL